jgi:ADP-heptose:LPS heptosyltransferase
MQVEPRLLQVDRRPAEVRTPGSAFESVRRLIVVRHDRFGDLVLSLPAVEALRRAYPSARLALMVRPDLAPLARMVPAADEVLGAHADRARLRREIAQFEADLVVCISRGAGMSRVAARARVPERVGTGYRMYSPLFTRTVNERRRAGDRHEVEYALSFAHRAGAPAGPAVFPLAVTGATRARVADWLAGHDLAAPYVVIHPGSGGSCPRWPVRHFIALAALLLAQGAHVVFSIGPEDARCEEVLDTARSRVRGLPRYREGLELLPALMQSAALVVSNSTGPLHLAAALGRPTLGFYAPWSTCGVTRWGPYAGNGWALAAASAEAQRWSRGERRRMGCQLLASIPVELAARCATALLEGRRPSIGGLPAGTG